MYEPCWIHPSDAAPRGIVDGDIIMVHNDRGGVLCGAVVTERIIPGALSIDHGAKIDMATLQNKLIDRGGCINLIAPSPTEKYGAGKEISIPEMNVSGFLAQVEKIDTAEIVAGVGIDRGIGVAGVDRQRLIAQMGKKSFLIDVDKCSGCSLCIIACKDEHVGNSYAPWTATQPDTGHFWIDVIPVERGKTPRVRMSYLPMLCQHCENAPCIKACPEGAIKRRDDGLVWIDPAPVQRLRSLPEEPVPTTSSI